MIIYVYPVAYEVPLKTVLLIKVVS